MQQIRLRGGRLYVFVCLSAYWLLLYQLNVQQPGSQHKHQCDYIVLLKVRWGWLYAKVLHVKVLDIVSFYITV